MKIKYSKLVCIALLLSVGIGAFAQQRRATQRRPSAYDQQPPANNANQQQRPQQTNNAPSAYGQQPAAQQPRDTALPITTVKSTTGGLIDSVKQSLRNDGAIEKNLVKDRAPLEYEHLREDDAVYSAKVWREIDIREKINLPFRYAATEDNGNQRFISILLRAIKEDGITAFSGDDDRFTTPITPDDAMNAFGGGMDTSKKYDRDGNVIGYEVRAKAVSPDSIYKFRIKEEWIFDKEASRMFVRIIGIAPVIPYKLSNGDVVPNSERPVWWVYYPDIRAVLAKYQVYNGKNYSARMTWEELFESRMFSSYIIKSTINNPYDKFFADYIKDPLFRLLEGDNVKEKIFDYEQSLWAY